MSQTEEARSARPSRQRRWWLVLVVVTVLLAAAVTLLLRALPAETKPVARAAPTAPPTPSPSPSPTPAQCDVPATRPFEPKRITIPGIMRNAKVLALPRDGNNVPSVPPVSAKEVLAWDRPPGIKPGEPKGNVLINAHTWPDGSALGNQFLKKLKVGKRIVVRDGDTELCYEIDKEIEVLAADGYPPYYDKEGPHRLALLVCSGKRLGPGNWTHRTIWFASPI